MIRILKIIITANKKAHKRELKCAEEKGIKEGKLQTAKELLKLGMSIEEIVKVTKLEKQEIEKLKE